MSYKTTSKTFEDLVVWQKSRELSGIIYRVTKHFPREENYGLLPQMRRAVISVSSNIAEGFGRHQNKDKGHYYVMALGSLAELQSQLIISNDLKYISDNDLKEAKNTLIATRKLLSALLVIHRS